MYSKVESEPKHEVATIERELQFRKRMPFSFLGFGFFKVAYYSFSEAFLADSSTHARTHARGIVSNAREISREC